MTTRNAASAGVCLVLMLCITSCADGEQPATPPSSTPSATATQEPITLEELAEYEEADEDASESPTYVPVVSDPALLETMECEPLSSKFLEAVKLDVGIPTRSVQVKVGKGSTAGEDWWVVVLDSPPDDSYEWGIRPFLTSAPGAPDFKGKWIVLEDEQPWRSVDWPEGKLVAGQSALEKAYDCLDVEP